MASETKICQIGDKVKIVSGPYEGRMGTVTHVRCPEDILFPDAQKSLHGLLQGRLPGGPGVGGPLVEEAYALVKTRLINEIDGEAREEEIGVPVRRLKPIG